MITLEPMTCTKCLEEVHDKDIVDPGCWCCGCYRVNKSDLEAGFVKLPPFWATAPTGPATDRASVLEWAAAWIEGSVGESATPEVREFAHNMAMSIRARITQGW